jgi:hypothetical protein
MTPLTYTTKFTLAIALLPPFLISLWMMAVPETLSSSTYAMFAALLVALSAITLNTYRNGRAPGSLGQLLHATETAQPSPARKRMRSTGANRLES